MTRRMRGRWRLGWLMVFVAATLAGFSIGLFDHLRYDTSVFVAVLLALAVPHVAACCVREGRISGASAAAVFGRVVGFAGLLWLVPLVLFLIRGLWAPHCDLARGILWMLLIPGVTAIYVSALGLFFALATSRVRTAVIASTVFIVLTLLIAVRHLIVDPPLYAVNGVIGYIPGPIYDAIVAISPPLLWGRVGTSAWTLLFLSLIAMMHDQRLALDPARLFRLGGRGLASLGVMISIAALTFFHVQRQELGTSPDADSIQQALGGQLESGHFVLFYDEVAISESRAVDILDDHEFRLSEVCRELGIHPSDIPEKIRSYVYANPDRKKQLMGARHTSFADPFARAMHLNDEPLPHPVLKHELVHVVSKDYAGWLGFNPRIGIHEGLAVAVDWEQPRLTPDQWAAVMQQEGLLPPLSQLASIAFWRAPSTRAYLSTGSFIRFLMERAPPDEVLAFFGDNDYRSHFGADRDSLEAAWHGHLAEVEVSPAEREFGLARVRRRAIFDRVCPRAIAALVDDGWSYYAAGRFDESGTEFDRVLELSPHDDGAALGRLRSLIGAEQHDDIVDAALDLVDRLSSSARTRDEARTALAHEAWRRGDPDEARRWLDDIVAANTTDSLVRAAQIKLEVLEHDEYRRVFTERLTESETIATLTRLAAQGPEMGVAEYLLGRRLFSDESFEAASASMERAWESRLPTQELRAEAARVLGVIRYRLRDYDGAEIAFAHLLSLDRGEAEHIRAKSWIERMQWLKEHSLIDVSPNSGGPS